MKHCKYALLGLALAALASCSHPRNGWAVSGTVADAPEDAKLAVDGFSRIGWYNIDSVAIAPDGSFKFQAQKGAPYPDVYRLVLDGKSIYFPIDSLDAITVEANAANFDTGYKLAGSPNADALMRINDLIANHVAFVGAEAAAADPSLQQQLIEEILADSTGIVSYYLLNKTIGGRPIFAMDNKQDVRVLGAVANKFAHLLPADPRTEVLAERYVRARQSLGGKQTVIEADASGLFEIALYDEQGTVQSLDSLARASKATLLSFTLYDSEPSLAYNVELNRLIDKYGARGLAIYQVSFDEDEAEWAKSARNLPWVTVRNNPVDGDMLLRLYNIGALPMTYLIDGNGDLVERIIDPADLDATIQKHLR